MLGKCTLKQEISVELGPSCEKLDPTKETRRLRIIQGENQKCSIATETKRGRRGRLVLCVAQCHRKATLPILQSINQLRLLE